MNKRKWLAALVVAVLVIGLAGLREYLEKKENAKLSTSDEYAEAVSEDHPLLLKFEEDHPDDEILLACADDVNNDGTEDLIVIIYGEDVNQTIAMISEEDGYFYAEPTPAPRENQKIKFTNIDKGEDHEVLITGEKNGQVGYALYKVMGHEFRDLYGENMKNCC